MAAAPSYRVIFDGRLREGFEEQQVKQALGQRLKLPSAQVERLFSGKPVVLKQAQSIEEAKQLAQLLAGLGAIAQVRATAAKPKTDPAPSDAKPAKTTKPAKPIPRLPDYRPYPKGLRFNAALLAAVLLDSLLNAIYLLGVAALALVLLYFSLFSGWGTALVGNAPLGLLLQLLGLALGLGLWFFLAKPLLALNPHFERGIVVTAEQEPDLYAFIADVCEKIKAPPPQEIRINNETTVALGYRRGPLGFVLNQSILTLGAPLVAANDVSRLAGLCAQALRLAHGKNLLPRAANLLRMSDAWLQRALYGKDELDRYLSRLIAEQRVLAGLAKPLQKAIAKSRTLMIWRLNLSRRLNRPLIQRLVAEADTVTLAFVGSAGFSELLEQQRLLAFGWQKVIPSLRERWMKEGRLEDNLVQTMVARCQRYPDSVHRQLRELQEKAKIASQDTIPADSQRLQRIAMMKVPAAYQEHAPSSTLFRDFTKLAKTMTVRFYQGRLHIPINPDSLLPVVAASEQERQYQQQIAGFFAQLYDDFSALKLRQQLGSAAASADALGHYRTAREQSAEALSQVKAAKEDYLNSQRALVEISLHEVMYRAERWRQWDLEPLKRNELEHVHDACREKENELLELRKGLQQALAPHAQRLASALNLLALPQAATVNNADTLHKEALTLIEVLERIEPVLGQLWELRLHTYRLRSLLSFDNGRSGKLHDRIREEAADIEQLITGLAVAFRTTPYPFSEASSYNNLMDYALAGAYPDEDPGGDFDRGNEVVERIAGVRRKIIARLCAIGTYAEKALGEA